MALTFVLLVLLRQDLPAPFEEREFSCPTPDGRTVPVKCVVLSPRTIEPHRTYPLVLFLHGAGERGSNLSSVIRHFPERMAEDSLRDRFPCFVIAPQCPLEEKWTEDEWGDLEPRPLSEHPTAALQTAFTVFVNAVRELPVDRRRLYVTGLSMGGFGAWELALRHPDLFAAVVPICGGGDERLAARLVETPVWAFHGARDDAVPVERSRRMIQAIRQAGGSPRYTEYEDVGHDAWIRAYGNPDGVIRWMFEHVQAPLGAHENGKPQREPDKKMSMPRRLP